MSEIDQLAETDPFIPYADLEGGPRELQSLLDAYQERMGFLPNALKLYAHRPHLLRQIIKLNNMVMRAPENLLPEEFKYRMSFIISRNHGCRYCCAHHAATLKRKFGCDDQTLEAILHLRSPRDTREAVAWEFADAASKGPEHVTEELRQRLAAEFSPPEVIEIACTLGFWAFYNRVHANLAVPIEEHLLSESHWVEVGRP